MPIPLDAGLPDPVTKENRLFYLCGRCGIERDNPSRGKPGLCWDCYDAEHNGAQIAAIEAALALIDEGSSIRAAAEKVGVARQTIAKWRKKLRSEAMV